MPVSLDRRTLLAGVAACAATTATSQDRGHAAAQATATDDVAPGRVLATLRDGAIETIEARGHGSLEHARPLSAHSVFHLASLSKQFTATAIALLEGDGKLTLDDPVARFVPEAKHEEHPAPRPRVHRGLRRGARAVDPGCRTFRVS